MRNHQYERFWPYTGLLGLLPIAVMTIGCSREMELPPPKVVYITEMDSGYQLMRNGIPFRVKGAAVGNSNWEEFRDAGGNTIRLYDTIGLKSKLDQARDLGLAVAVDIPLPAISTDYDPYSDPEWLQETERRIMDLGRSYSNHPALLFWVLGNEISFYSTDSKKILGQINSLAHILKLADPNHPVTTATLFSRRVILNLILNCPNLDFLSINVFGMIREFEKRKKFLAPFWKEPYMISEWGINGPWEADIFTEWGAPIEQTSTKKAEQYQELYRILLEQDQGRILGDFIFYWGQKEERTPTWFSAFLPDGSPTQIVTDVSQLWGNSKLTYTGPRIDYLLLEGKGAPSNIILDPGRTVQASLRIAQPIGENLSFSWEIRPEHWYRPGSFERESQMEMPVIPTEFQNTGLGEVSFKTPMEPGPYRLYVYLTDSQGFGATSNIPFFILEPKYGL